ncbi:putative S-adenosyl-L-methionine-dependent methyltransferase [Mumia flava]|uniref:Putative S-adenosyl-L-methionine-dependent methyltransferase n=1 Tax=Mumia flava TaxID=1348852 RepID=A0A2M9BJK9_9ACTN|nr:SAM-dependent methyltransferase [Mumia flava]PJJ58121.1 putative S-adenosyl-L-methionine-dependent methyltransferase [Mumia flava]
MIRWHDAWQDALYGTDGFFVREQPADHFRTSVHASVRFAEAVLVLARSYGLSHVVDLGAGSGELLVALDLIAGDELTLDGVDLRGRPEDLPDRIGWAGVLPDRVEGLLVANELLDDVPCEVVERDTDGAVRVVLVDPATGEETLGDPVGPDALAWLARWWPLDRAGERAEVGSTRDDLWRDAVRRVEHGVAVTIDYGHLRDDRPAFGGLRAYRAGAETDVRPDGTCDVTAPVAVDALADAVDGRVRRQRDVLRDLGVDGTRPPLESARTDPVGYLHALQRASEGAELTAPGGLGDFWWVLTEHP